MKRFFCTGPVLIAGLIAVLASGVVMAETSPASYVKPGVDLSVYKRVMVKPLNMDNIEVLKPVWEQDNEEEWSFNPENRAAVQEWFLDAMQQELETEGGYAMVSEPAADVLANAGFEDTNILDVSTYIGYGSGSPFDRFFLSASNEFAFARQYVLQATEPAAHDNYLPDHRMILMSFRVKGDND